MSPTANPTLPLLHVGRGAQYGALTLFPVWADGGAATGLEWDLGALDVAEHDGGGQVNSLAAINSGDKPVVLLEGDLLEGGWQTRMIARSTILGPHETTNLAALCVEQGRWESSGNRGHRAAGRRVSASLRAARDRACRRGDDPQHEVWHGIASRYETNVRTATSSFADHLDRVARERSRRTERPLPAKPLAGQRGVIIGIGGRVLGMELLATPNALAKRWTGILEAARFDADRAPEAATSGQRARDFAVKVECAHLDVARESASVVTLAADRRSLHLSGIALPEPVRSIDGEFWRIVHLAAYDQAHPLLAGV
ncbi:ARPP-1 family domain-containing protein [Mycolicibacter sinensis]